MIPWGASRMGAQKESLYSGEVEDSFNFSRGMPGDKGEGKLGLTREVSILLGAERVEGKWGASIALTTKVGGKGGGGGGSTGIVSV